MSDEPISYAPTDGLSYDPAGAEVLGRGGPAARRSTRVFEICHGCRMCFKYCDAFPHAVRSRSTSKHDGDVDAAHARPRPTRSWTTASSASCARCSARTRRATSTPSSSTSPSWSTATGRSRRASRASSLRDRFLGDPDAARAGGRAASGGLVEHDEPRGGRTAGSWRRRWASTATSCCPTSPARRSRSGPSSEGLIPAAPGGEAVLFQTCYVQNNEPADRPRHASRCSASNQVDVRCARGLACCGMPAWESGDLPELQKRAHAQPRRPAALRREGRQGAGDQPDLLDDAAARVPRPWWRPRTASAPTQLADGGARPQRVPLVDARRAALLARLQVAPRRRSPTTRPATCARRRSASAAATSSGAPGCETSTFVAECCGHDGTYAMKVEGFEAVAAHRREGLRRHAGARGHHLGDRLSAGRASSSSSTPAASRCTRCRCWRAPTAGERVRPATSRRPSGRARRERVIDAQGRTRGAPRLPDLQRPPRRRPGRDPGGQAAAPGARRRVA